MKTKANEKESHKVIKIFCNKVFYIKSLYYIQENLFKGENIHLLNKTAPAFFSDINNLLINYIILEMVKITDPKESRNNENISVENIIESIDWDNPILKKLKEINGSIRKFRCYINRARNKIIAHNDKKTYMSNEVLGNFPMKDGLKFFSNLEKICNICHKECFGIIFGDMCMGHSGDVIDFIKILKKAIAFDKILDNAKGEDLYRLDSLLHSVH